MSCCRSFWQDFSLVLVVALCGTVSFTIDMRSKESFLNVYVWVKFLGICDQILLELCFVFNLLEVPVSSRGWRWFEFLVLDSVPGPTLVPLWFCARSHYELKAGPGVGEPKSWCPGVKQTGPGLLHRSECTNRSALAQPRQQQMVKMSVEICSYMRTYRYVRFKLFYFCNSH